MMLNNVGKRPFQRSCEGKSWNILWTTTKEDIELEVEKNIKWKVKCHKVM